MTKDAVIQSIVSNNSNIKVEQVNTIHLKNMDWEFAIRVLMLLLGNVINKSSLDEPFTAEMINESITLTKEILDGEKRLYDDPFTMYVQAPDPLNELDELIDIIDKIDRNEETKAYVSINWYIENGKINLSKTMVTGIENIFERKYIPDANEYDKVVKNILNEMPITDTILRTRDLRLCKTDEPINNINMQSLRSVYEKYLTTSDPNRHTWLYSPKSKIIINITGCNILTSEQNTIKKLTDERLLELINTCTTTAVATNPKTDDKVIFYMIKITDHPISTIIPLEDLLTIPTYDWLAHVKYYFTRKFYDWIKFDYEWDKDRYIKLCEDLNLPKSIKDSYSEFDITYLTEDKFDKCNEDDMTQIFGEMWKPLSDDEINTLCKVKL